jgi:hypothetical protein
MGFRRRCCGGLRALGALGRAERVGAGGAPGRERAAARERGAAPCNNVQQKSGPELRFTFCPGDG